MKNIKQIRFFIRHSMLYVLGKNNSVKCMNIALSSLFLSMLLSGCEVFELASYMLIDIQDSITYPVALRGSCANPHEGQVGVKIVEIDGQTGHDLINYPNDSPRKLSKGQHEIGIKLGHLSKIQRLTLEFSSKHRYLLSATFNSNTNMYQAHIWDESKYPAKKLSSFEFEATPDEIWKEKLEQFNCNSDR